MKREGIIKFVFDKLPLGAFVYDAQIEIIYSNKKADLFLKSCQLPPEVPSVGRRIFDAIGASKSADVFPGEIYIHKSLGPEDASVKWTFKMDFMEGPEPLVVVFIIRDSISSRLDLNKLRPQFKLTRRETDVLRRVIDGLKNSEISDDLSISEQTVKDHLSNIYMKIDVKNRFDLMRMLIDLPPT